MADPIKHIILLMLENHSFDQMLGCFRSIDARVDGVDPASPHSNTDSDGTVYFQKETDEVQTLDPRHEFTNVKEQLANNNGGFVRDFSSAYPGKSKSEDRQEIMGYYGVDKLPALHALARDFTVCDRWFSSLPGPTWPNRFFALTGTSNGEIEMPSGWQQANPGWYFHQTQTTIFDRLNEKGKSWKVYYYDFPNSWLLMHQLQPANLAKYHHIDNFFKDVRNEQTFPEFVFIEPKYFGQDQNDDHPPHNIMKAEKLVADVYNAIRSSPDLWNSSLLVVSFDEHGGFYDHVVPPAAVAPDDKTKDYAFNQLGLRVPAVLVSPWVARDVNHTIFDHTSPLKYMLDKWSLASLGNRTAAANSISVALNQTAPRQDTVPFIRVPYTDLIAPKPELEKETVSDHQTAIRGFARALEQQTGDARFAEPQKEPGTLLSARKKLGQVLIKAGNWMTSKYQKVQEEKVSRLTNLVKDVAAGRLRPNIPE